MTEATKQNTRGRPAKETHKKCLEVTCSQSFYKLLTEDCRDTGAAEVCAEASSSLVGIRLRAFRTWGRDRA